MLPSWVTALTVGLLVTGTAGHAGSHTEAEIQAEIQLRSIVSQHSKRALDKCANSPAAREIHARAVARRTAKAHALRLKRGLTNDNVIKRRQAGGDPPTDMPTDGMPGNSTMGEGGPPRNSTGGGGGPGESTDNTNLATWAALSHNSSEAFHLSTLPADIFSSNATCALVPEVTIGPYYVSGELLRSDITDDETGVPVHLDIQFISTSDCSPIPANSSTLLIDIWHCNAMGVYSGVSAQGQDGVLTTHGRGVQATDDEGVVQFDTMFPGHYTGRATHIHVMATEDYTLLENNTFTGGKARHIGQLFFDQDLREAVEQTAPYNTNTQEVTQNLDDGIGAGEATEEYDPFLNYVWLGDKLEDGLLMWITIGIDLEADYSSQVSAATHFEGNNKTDTEINGTTSSTKGTNWTSTLTSTGAVASSTTSFAGAQRRFGSILGMF